MQDLHYGCVYVTDVGDKSSAGYNVPCPKATQKVICLSYGVKIAGHCIFLKSEATTTLAKLRDREVFEFHIIFPVEPKLMATRKQHNTDKLAFFAPNTKWKGNKLPTNDLNLNRVAVVDNCIHVESNTVNLTLFQDNLDMDFEDICDGEAPELDLQTIRAIAAPRSGLYFSEDRISSIMILTVINSITS